MAVGDVDGNGTQNLILALPDGTVWALFRKLDAEPCSLQVEGGAPGLGVVNVSAWEGKRCLGARQMSVGKPAFFGLRGPATVTVRWRRPGRAAEEHTLRVTGARRLLLPGPADPVGR